jgi:NAD(P)-dependent dehydrogenase (short-subunit alcohol dehydrogenase family)
MMGWNLEEQFSIKGKIVAVTGAGGVLYGAISKALAANGAKVALLDILGDKVEELAAEIKAGGGEAIGIGCSVLDIDQMQAALDKILETWGACGVLINGAGGNQKAATVAPDGVFTDLDPDALARVFALNYTGTFLPTQVFCRQFAKTGEGCVINTSSMSALMPLTNVAGYSNAKAAVSNLTKWLAVQVKVDFPNANIRVNEIAPGFLVTTQNKGLLYDDEACTQLTKRGNSIIANTPMDRFGDPDELIGAIVLLMSKAGSFIHGSMLPIDGGFAIYSGVGPLDEKK